MNRFAIGTVVGVLLVAPTSAAVASSADLGAGSDPARLNSTLMAMDATSADDVWAVGYQGPEGGDRTSYVRHWDGTSWKTVDSPYVAGGYLASVTAIAPDDVWAVGSSGYESSNLAEHWDGTSWTVVPVPNRTGYRNGLSNVSFVSSHQVLAVGGWYSEVDGGVTALLWNGSKWAEAPASYDGITRIDALSPADAWGVGRTPEHTTLAKHWDGTTWRTVPTPVIASVASSLLRVAMISPTDVWATGQEEQSHQTFLEHWDGDTWTVVDDAIDAGFSVATDISATASDDVWVSGHTYVDGFLEHWDGRTWTAVPSPGGALPLAELDGVAAASTTDAWSVGSWYKCTGGRHCYTKRIIQHWNGEEWTAYVKP